MKRAFRGNYSITKHKEITPGIFELCVKAPEIAGAASAGQFVNIYLPGGVMLLPRPMGIADAGGDVLTLVYATVGKGTGILSHISEGKELEIMGPLGTGFFNYSGSPTEEDFTPDRQGPRKTQRLPEPQISQRLPEPQESLRPQRSQGLPEIYNVLLIGGGTGIPLLYFAARKLKVALRGRVRVVAVLGFREHPWYEDRLESACDMVKLCSETEGMAEFHGNVIELMDAAFAEGARNTAKPSEIDLALAVGPRPMMEAAAQWCASRDIPLRVSLEERMGCGYGACAGCIQKTRPLVKASDSSSAFNPLASNPSTPQNGPNEADKVGEVDEDGIVRKKVCVHGPVFWADEVIW